MRRVLSLASGGFALAAGMTLNVRFFDGVLRGFATIFGDTSRFAGEALPLRFRMIAPVARWMEANGSFRRKLNHAAASDWMRQPQRPLQGRAPPKQTLARCVAAEMKQATFLEISLWVVV
jgi:hypothetical protein